MGLPAASAEIFSMAQRGAYYWALTAYLVGILSIVGSKLFYFF